MKLAPVASPRWVRWTAFYLSLPFRAIAYLGKWAIAPVRLIWREMLGLRSEEMRSLAMFLLAYAGGFTIARIDGARTWDDPYFLIGFTTVLVAGGVILGIQWFKLRAAQIQIEAGGSAAMRDQFRDKAMGGEQRPARQAEYGIDDPDGEKT